MSKISKYFKKKPSAFVAEYGSGQRVGFFNIGLGIGKVLWHLFYTLEPLLKTDLHWTQLSGTEATLSYMMFKCFYNSKLKQITKVFIWHIYEIAFLLFQGYFRNSWSILCVLLFCGKIALPKPLWTRRSNTCWMHWKFKVNAQSHAILFFEILNQMLNNI